MTYIKKLEKELISKIDIPYFSNNPHYINKWIEYYILKKDIKIVYLMKYKKISLNYHWIYITLSRFFSRKKMYHVSVFILQKAIEKNVYDLEILKEELKRYEKYKVGNISEKEVYTYLNPKDFYVLDRYWNVQKTELFYTKELFIHENEEISFELYRLCMEYPIIRNTIFRRSKDCYFKKQGIRLIEQYSINKRLESYENDLFIKRAKVNEESSSSIVKYTSAPGIVKYDKYLHKTNSLSLMNKFSNTDNCLIYFLLEGQPLPTFNAQQGTTFALDIYQKHFIVNSERYCRFPSILRKIIWLLAGMNCNVPFSHIRTKNILRKIFNLVKSLKRGRACLGFGNYPLESSEHSNTSLNAYENYKYKSLFVFVSALLHQYARYKLRLRPSLDEDCFINTGKTFGYDIFNFDTFLLTCCINSYNHLNQKDNPCLNYDTKSYLFNDSLRSIHRSLNYDAIEVQVNSKDSGLDFKNFNFKEKSRFSHSSYTQEIDFILNDEKQLELLDTEVGNHLINPERIIRLKNSTLVSISYIITVKEALKYCKKKSVVYVFMFKILDILYEFFSNDMALNEISLEDFVLDNNLDVKYIQFDKIKPINHRTADIYNDDSQISDFSNNKSSVIFNCDTENEKDEESQEKRLKYLAQIFLNKRVAEKSHILYDKSNSCAQSDTAKANEREYFKEKGNFLRNEKNNGHKNTHILPFKIIDMKDEEKRIIKKILKLFKIDIHSGGSMETFEDLYLYIYMNSHDFNCEYDVMSSYISILENIRYERISTLSSSI